MTRISAPIISPIINRLHHRCTMLIYLVQHNANTKRHTKQTSLVVGRFSSEFCFSFYIFVSYINVNFLSRRLRSFVGFSCLLSSPVLRFILNNIFGLLNKHISMDIRKNRILMQCEHREWSFSVLDDGTSSLMSAADDDVLRCFNYDRRKFCFDSIIVSALCSSSFFCSFISRDFLRADY